MRGRHEIRPALCGCRLTAGCHGWAAYALGERERRRDMAEIIPPPLRRVSVPRGQRNDAPKIQADVVLISEADRPVKLNRLLDDLQRAICQSAFKFGSDSILMIEEAPCR